MSKTEEKGENMQGLYYSPWFIVKKAIFVYLDQATAIENQEEDETVLKSISSVVSPSSDDIKRSWTERGARPKTTQLRQKGHSKYEEAPKGPGWKRLSEEIYFCNKKPLKPNGRVYNGKLKIAGKWLEIAVKLVKYEEKNWREVNLLLDLEEHPNVIRLYAAGVTDDTIPHIYIAMELCSQSLKDYVEQNQHDKMEFLNSFTIAKQIFEAIAFIHGKNIIHRDIKLENILLSKVKSHIKIADFGLSKKLEDGKSTTRITTIGLGTDGYVAPEMYKDDAKASFKSDVFSLGIVTYEIFANGKHPFGSDPSRWRTNIIDNKNLELSSIPQFQELYSRKRAQLMELLIQSLQHKADDRPKVEELLQHPFFTEPYGAESITIIQRQNIITQRYVSGGGHMESHDQECTNTMIVTLQQTEKEENSRTTSNDLKKAMEGSISGRTRDELQDLQDSKYFHELLKQTEHELLLDIAKGDPKIHQLKSLLTRTIQSEECDQKTASYIKRNCNKMGQTLQKQGHHVKALILYKIYNDLLDKHDWPPEERVKFIANQVSLVNGATIPLVTTSKDIALTLGFSCMTCLWNDLNEISIDDKKLHVLMESSCLVNISTTAFRLQKFKEMLSFSHLGVTRLEKQFGSDAVKYKYYCRLLNNLGAAYMRSKEFTKAESVFEKSIDANKQATDFTNEDERRQFLDVAKKNLAEIRKIMTSSKISSNQRNVTDDEENG